VNGARQCESIEHVLRQLPVPHMYGEQLCVVAVAQVPVPVQRETSVSVEPEQVCVPHDTVVAASAHAPAPLQAPVFPQGGLATQRLSRTPLATLAQLPAAAPTLHAWHKLHELVLQQTPLVQKLPVRHSVVLAQGWPRRFLLPQRLVCRSQIFGARQSPSPVQAARHAVAPLQT
jgi:hypothetical protein